MSLQNIKIIDKYYEFNFLISSLIDSNRFNEIRKVLDVGCGENGSIFKILGKNYTGLDINNEKLSSYEDELKEIDGEHQLINSEFLKRDFKNKKFDLVVMNNFLNEVRLSEIEATLERAFELLEPNGQLFVKVNSLFSSQIEKAKTDTSCEVQELKLNKFFVEDQNYSYNFFSKEELFSLFVDSGFEVEYFKREDYQEFPRSYPEQNRSEFSILGYVDEHDRRLIV